MTLLHCVKLKTKTTIFSLMPSLEGGGGGEEEEEGF
jgi:hypothetical protein